MLILVPFVSGYFHQLPVLIFLPQKLGTKYTCSCTYKWYTVQTSVLASDMQSKYLYLQVICGPNICTYAWHAVQTSVLMSCVWSKHLYQQVMCSPNICTYKLYMVQTSVPTSDTQSKHLYLQVVCGPNICTYELYVVQTSVPTSGVHSKHLYLQVICGPNICTYNWHAVQTSVCKPDVHKWTRVFFIRECQIYVGLFLFFLELKFDMVQKHILFKWHTLAHSLHIIHCCTHSITLPLA